MNQRRTSPKSTVPRSFALFLAKGRESTTLNMPVHQERSWARCRGPRRQVFVAGVAGRPTESKDLRLPLPLHLLLFLFSRLFLILLSSSTPQLRQPFLRERARLQSCRNLPK